MTQYRVTEIDGVVYKFKEGENCPFHCWIYDSLKGYYSVCTRPEMHNEPGNLKGCNIRYCPLKKVEE